MHEAQRRKGYCGAVGNTDRIDRLYQDLHEKELPFVLHDGDITDSTSRIRVIQHVQPSELSNLPAQSHVAVSFEEPEYTADSDALSALRMRASGSLNG